MTDALDDLRVLRLAQLHERAYEQFVREVAAGIDVPAVKRLLQELAPDDDAHRTLVDEHIKRVLASLDARERRLAERAALLAVIEVERAAHELYVSNMDNVHDPAVVDLFESLAHEEAEHVRIAKRALDAHEAASRAASQ